MTGGFGKWTICNQNPLPDARPWNGRVLTLWVIPVDDVPDRDSAASVCAQLMAGQATP